jgi:hypothetical protein
MKTLFLSAVTLAMICVGSHRVVSQPPTKDDRLYETIATIRGTVRISRVGDSHDAETVRSNAYLVFQRIGCKKCLIVVIADENGQYELRLGEGRYRLIVREEVSQGRLVDVIAPNQDRVLDVPRARSSYVMFDVLLYYPQSPLHVTRP